MRSRRIIFSEYYDNIILEELSKIYNVDRDRIFLGSREKNIIFAKRMYIFVLRNIFHLTLVEIAELTNMHHSSIIHHTRKFEFFYNNYPEDTQQYKKIEERITEVEVDEEINALETRKKTIEETLTELYKIKKQKHEREKRKNLLT